MLDHLKAHLAGKTVILGMGNTLRSDDGAGSILASRIKHKVPYEVYDAGVSPENYLERIIKQGPDNIVIVDAADFGAKPGECRLVEGAGVKTINLFSTHNLSISMLINYLQSNSKADIIILFIQPETLALGDKLSEAVSSALDKLENWILSLANDIELLE